MPNSNSFVLLFIVVIGCSLVSFVDSRSSSRTSSGLSCDRIPLRNGAVRYRERKSTSRSFTCNKTFKLHGPRYSKCVNGRWNEDMPICIKSGCEMVATPTNSVIDFQNNEAAISIHCMYGFQLVGNKEAFCNGTDWDRPLGTCRLADTATRTECDFEAVDMCGWGNDLDNSYDWRRRNGFASFATFVSGPTHDHTTGKPLMGHYMVAEAAGTRNSQVARLVSPIYNQTMSTKACFRMFSHLYGATVGALNVYIKPDSLNIVTVRNDQRFLLFHKQGNFGNHWVEDFMPVEAVEEDFQIVIEAKPVNGIISDIAIDDVALLSGSHCIQLVQNGTDVTTEEPNGVYDVMSCINRCNETSSLRNATKFEPDMMTGKQVEVCDCHEDCGYFDTCCPDYNDHCALDDSYATDLITESNSKPASAPTVAIPRSTSASIFTSKSMAPSTTPSMTSTSSTIPSTTPSTTPSTIPSTILSTTSSTTLSTTQSTTSSTPSPATKATTTQNSDRVVTTVKTTLRPIITLNTTLSRITKKITEVPVLATTSTPTKSPNHVSIIMLSLLIATVLSVVCLVIFVLINKKWKPYNVDAIEFKTKYYSNKVEEPLLCNYGDAEQILMPETRRECATSAANQDEATVQVDVIQTQTVDETKTSDTMDASKQKKKSMTKTKLKNDLKRKASDDVGLLLDSDEEHLDFSLQDEIK